LGQLNKDEPDVNKYERLFELLQRVSSKLPEQKEEEKDKDEEKYSKSKNMKFEEDCEIIIQKDKIKFYVKYIIKKNINKIRLNFDSEAITPILHPKELILIYGYNRNKFIGQSGLQRKLLHTITYQDLLFNKDALKFSCKYQAISVCFISNVVRNEEEKIKFKAKGYEYISQAKFSSIPGLIDNINLRKIEAFKKQLTDIYSFTGLKSASKEDEKTITEFLRSEFFWQGTLQKDSDEAKTNYDSIMPYIISKEKDNEDYEYVHDLLKLIHQQTMRRYSMHANIAGEQGFEMHKKVFFIIMRHFGKLDEFENLLEYYRCMISEESTLVQKMVNGENIKIKPTLTQEQKQTLWLQDSYKKIDQYWINTATFRQVVLKSINKISREVE